MKKFEYEVELVAVAAELPPVITVGNPKERLNILGRQGWELVAVSAHGNYYCGCFFKRELDSKKPSTHKSGRSPGVPVDSHLPVRDRHRHGKRE